MSTVPCSPTSATSQQQTGHEQLRQAEVKDYRSSQVLALSWSTRKTGAVCEARTNGSVDELQAASVLTEPAASACVCHTAEAGWGEIPFLPQK